ncbi:MAG: hypothetical protein LBI05_12230, partial [Planctomycetaceae bacterium]|nr:hypothetical protein [Planctomycetaceae bacterium]
MATNAEGVDATELIRGLVQVRESANRIGLSQSNLETVQRAFYGVYLCGGIDEAYPTSVQTQAVSSDHPEPVPKKDAAETESANDAIVTEQQTVEKKTKWGSRPVPEPANAKRDARIFELRLEGKSFAEVCVAINEEFPEEFLDDGSAQAALRRYCDRNQINYPHGKR